MTARRDGRCHDGGQETAVNAKNIDYYGNEIDGGCKCFGYLNQRKKIGAVKPNNEHC